MASSIAWNSARLMVEKRLLGFAVVALQTRTVTWTVFPTATTTVLVRLTKSEVYAVLGVQATVMQMVKPIVRTHASWTAIRCNQEFAGAVSPTQTRMVMALLIA
jgi:hypothetical protein